MVFDQGGLSRGGLLYRPSSKLLPIVLITFLKKVALSSLIATGKIAMFLLHLCDDVIVQIPVYIAKETGRVALAAV